MITTRFLSESEYPQYASWVKKLDPATRVAYFGIQYTYEQIDRLVRGIVDNANQHNFLVAEYKGAWIGTIHIAETEIDEVEFGVIVATNHNKGRNELLRIQREIHALPLLTPILNSKSRPERW